MKFSERLLPLGLLASLLMPAVGQAAMPSVEVIGHFTGNTPEGGNGAAPEAPLMEGADGTIYGSTRSGGGTAAVHNSGGPGESLFKFTPGAAAESGLIQVSRSLNGFSGLYSQTRSSRGSDGYYYATWNSDGNSARSVARYLPGSTAWEPLCCDWETSFPATSAVRRPTSVIAGSDGRLYGTSPASGTAASSLHGNAVWAVSKDGTGLTVLHGFSESDKSNGSRPDFVMQGSDGKLYGLARQGGTPTGGAAGTGVLFSLNTDGTGFTKLHDFSAADGNLSAVPRQPLVEVGSRLYGITASGGTNGTGTLYRINRDGTGFEVLHHFTVAAANTSGRAPSAILLAQDGHLYGITPNGGINNQGVIFRYHMTDGYQALYAFDEVVGPAVRGSNTGTNTTGAVPKSLMQASNGEFYGMAERGGSTGWGVVFRFKAGDEVPVFRFWPRTNFYMGAAESQPEHYPPYTRWSNGSVIVQNYNRLDMRWKLENVTDCVASSDQPGSNWSGPLDALAKTPISNGAGYSYYVDAAPTTVGTYTYTVTCKAADNGEVITDSVTLQVEPQDLPLKESKGGGGAFGAGLLPLLGAGFWLRRRRAA